MKLGALKQEIRSTKNPAVMVDIGHQRVPPGYVVVPMEPIATAPNDGSLCVVWVSPGHGLPGFWTVCAYHPDAGWCACELREVTHWVPLPNFAIVPTSGPEQKAEGPK